MEERMGNLSHAPVRALPGVVWVSLAPNTSAPPVDIRHFQENLYHLQEALTCAILRDSLCFVDFTYPRPETLPPPPTPPLETQAFARACMCERATAHIAPRTDRLTTDPLGSIETIGPHLDIT
jgi:hypothetical protein